MIPRGILSVFFLLVLMVANDAIQRDGIDPRL